MIAFAVAWSLFTMGVGDVPPQSSVSVRINVATHALPMVVDSSGRVKAWGR